MSRQVSRSLRPSWGERLLSLWSGCREGKKESNFVFDVTVCFHSVRDLAWWSWSFVWNQASLSLLPEAEPCRYMLTDMKHFAIRVRLTRKIALWDPVSFSIDASEDITLIHSNSSEKKKTQQIRSNSGKLWVSGLQQCFHCSPSWKKLSECAASVSPISNSHWYIVTCRRKKKSQQIRSNSGKLRVSGL